jgi:hypothetical protein
MHYYQPSCYGLPYIAWLFFPFCMFVLGTTRGDLDVSPGRDCGFRPEKFFLRCDSQESRPSRFPPGPDYLLSRLSFFLKTLVNLLGVLLAG